MSARADDNQRIKLPEAADLHNRVVFNLKSTSPLLTAPQLRPFLRKSFSKFRYFSRKSFSHIAGDGILTWAVFEGDDDHRSVANMCIGCSADWLALLKCEE